MEVDGVKLYFTTGELEDLRFGLQSENLQLIRQVLTDIEERAYSKSLLAKTLEQQYREYYED